MVCKITILDSVYFLGPLANTQINMMMMLNKLLVLVWVLCFLLVSQGCQLVDQLVHERLLAYYKCKNERAKEMAKINVLWKAIEEWDLVESPVAKLASNDVPPTESESDSEPDPDLSGVCGEEFVADFTLHKNIYISN